MERPARDSLSARGAVRRGCSLVAGSAGRRPALSAGGAAARSKIIKGEWLYRRLLVANGWRPAGVGKSRDLRFHRGARRAATCSPGKGDREHLAVGRQR